MGNSLGRALVGRSDTGVMRGWTGGKLWEKLRGKERYGSDDRVDGRETLGNSWGELRWEEATY